MDPKQYDALIANADTRLSRLRSLYEQWFAGIERVEPAKERDTFEKLMKQLQLERPNNTASRFRHQQLLQRFVTYTTYWRRIGRQIEEGTYKRDVTRARKNRERREEASPKSQSAFEIDVEVDLDMDQLFREAETSQEAAHMGDTASEVSGSPAALPASAMPVSAMPASAIPASATPASTPGRAPKVPNAAAAKPPLMAPEPRRQTFPPPPPQPRQPRRPTEPSQVRASASQAHPPRPTPGSRADRQPQMSDRQVQAIYERYVAARRQNSERIDNVKLATIAKSVRGMMPKLAQKHGDKKIDFEVVVRNGKVALKPVAK